jgi:3'-phosphoadenosine 5'-phosphosulfate sulfotransferase (PAPS reductase)/FAD synthetase
MTINIIKNKQLTFDGFGVKAQVVGLKETPTVYLPDLDSFEIIAVSVSGGKDSQACANLAFERFGKERVRLIHAMVEPADTPEDELLWETKENIEHLAYLEEIWNHPIERVLVFNPNRIGYKPKEMLDASEEEFEQKVKGMQGLTSIVLNNGYMPGATIPYCTKGKSLAIERWARQFGDKCKLLHIWGQRAEEGERRAKMPEYGMTEYKGYVWRPIHKWTEKQVLDYLAKLGQKINPVYSLPEHLRLGRGGNCMFCINQKKLELRKAVRLYPKEALNFVERIEKVVGQRRDYSVEQAISDAGLEQEIPGIFAENDEWEKGLPRKSCGVGDTGYGCDG